MIGNKVQDIIKLAETPIQLTSGTKQESLLFDYYEIVKRINYYLNSQYVEGSNDRIFWNIVNSRIVHVAKNIDLDTKDLQPYADGEASYVQSWILKMKFYKWLEDNHFALVLNSRSVGVASYGSWVWEVKKEGGKNTINDVDLASLYFDFSVKSIKDAYENSGVVRKYIVTSDYLETKRDVYSNIDIVLSKARDSEIELWQFDGEDDGYKRVIGYGYGDKAIVLYEKDMKKCPYYDFHIGEYQGRWLRTGVVERLFDLQVLANKKVNQNDRNQEIASLLLLRTTNPDLAGNVLNDVESGEIILSSDLQQIGITNTAFSSFINEMQQIENKADQLCLTPNIITAESTPSNIPFRSLATLTNAGKSAFRLIKESIGESTGYMLKEDIFPSVVREWSKEEIFELARDESDVKYFEKQMRKLVRWRSFVDNLLDGKVVNNEQLEQVEKVFDEEFETMPKKIKIPSNFFNFDFHIKTNITGESVDKTQRNDALFNALTFVQSNPAIINIPYFRQYCEENGINYWRLKPEEVEALKGEMKGQAPKEPMGESKDKLLSAVDSE